METDGDVEAIERWFVARGTPHFIEDYSAAEDVLTRTAGLLAIIAVGELTTALELEWRWWQNTLAALGAFAVVLATWAATNRVRNRTAFARPERVGVLEVALFVLAAPLATLVFGQARQALSLVVVNIVILGLIYAVASYAVIPLSRWAAGRMFREVGALAGLLSRALPLLVLFVTFLFVNTEVWQIAEAMEWEFLAATVALFVGFGVLFLLTQLPAEVGRLTEFESDEAVDELCTGTPAAAIAGRLAGLDIPPVEMSRRQRLNVYLVVLVSQAIQVIAISVVIFAFFVGFGLVAIRPDVIAAWIGDDAARETVLELEVLGHDLVLTAALLRVATFLATFSGFYFTVYVVTDATYRKQFFDQVIAEVRQTLAVRAAYVAHLTGRT